jgi:hypothetical protein
LRRLYEPTKKYGKVNPLNYPISVCPNCLFSTFKEDFNRLPEKSIELVRGQTSRRVSLLEQSIGLISFEEERTDLSGLASYLLAIHCYSFFDKSAAPTIKKGICALRAAWMLGDLSEESEDEQAKEKYIYIQNIMYRKAHGFYEASLQYLQTGEEKVEGVFLGPGIDKNWGYEGILYMTSSLQFKLGYLEKDLEVRGQKYLIAKRVISKLFGRGKASKSKPSEILDMSKDLYDKMTEFVKQLEEELGHKLD